MGYTNSSNNRTILVVLVIVIVLAAGLMVGYSMGLAKAADGSDQRPTFYNYPVLVLSGADTDDIAEALTLSTFNYRISKNVSVLDSVEENEMIIVDGAWYSSINGTARDQVVSGCAKALKNGSAIAYLGRGTVFTNAVEVRAYPDLNNTATAPSENEPEDAAGIWRSPDGAAVILVLSLGDVDPSEYYQANGLITEVYEWGIRAEHGQPDPGAP